MATPSGQPRSATSAATSSLQTNKVKDVVGRAHLIHSVDSCRLIDEIAHRARLAGVQQRVLLQVNVSGEESKHGSVPHEGREALVEASHQQGVLVRGLMTMAPFGGVAERHYEGNFSELHALELVFNPRLGVETKRLAAQRMLDFPQTLEGRRLLKFSLAQLARPSLMSKVRHYLSWPLGQLQLGILRLQDHHATVRYIHQLSASTGIGRKTHTVLGICPVRTTELSCVWQ